MVRNHHLLMLILSAFLFLTLLSSAKAWTGIYHLDKEWTKIWINQDGTIDLFYNITLTLDSGDNINYILIGQPQRAFTIGEATDQYDHRLTTSDVSQGSQYQVKVILYQPLTSGHSVWFTLTTNVAQMIYNDTMNAGNVGMQFIPCWWTVDVKDLRVAIVLPPNVTSTMVKTSRDWSNTMTEDGQLVVYWETQNLVPNQQYPVGVSFPREYLPSYTPPDGNPPPDVDPPPTPPPDYSSPTGTFPIAAPFLIGFAFVMFFVVMIVLVVGASKKRYSTPLLSMETLGIKHGLTAVEASYLLDMKPPRIVTEILYSLLQKRSIWVETTKPSIKIRTMTTIERKIKARDSNLRYYELDFLGSVKADGTLDEEKLAGTFMGLRDNVEEKMRGYSRRDTVDYYNGVVAKAWKQVEQAGTPELASGIYNEQLLWLLLDPNVRSRTQTAFRDRAFEPNPMWFWYWYGYQHYNPHPTYQPNIESPAQAAKPPTIPGAEFANNMVTSLEQTANNIVINIEKFANSITPAPPQSQQSSHEPVHHDASCVCACAACACACVCVSCACACAGGGVGIKGDGLKQ
jgi:hypothetical protein